jgi:hypothetical protein
MQKQKRFAWFKMPCFNIFTCKNMDLCLSCYPLFLVSLVMFFYLSKEKED